jgi:ferredoxin/flavodoxin---NADP+ reductase
MYYHRRASAREPTTFQIEVQRMATEIGTAARPLRVAIIGAGPSGYYAAGAFLGRDDLHAAIDIFDRLPTPFGLVRYGVAPDHPKIKSVIRVYEKYSLNPQVRFFGNVDFGADLTHDDIRRFYDMVIYAYGSSSDRKLGIPGEDLRGAYSATEFVGWYNSHPDFADLSFDIPTAHTAVVVGNGNVAMDVVRTLAESMAVLEKTDIADYALDVLRRSQIEQIYMLGRRGPVQAAFTNPELRELGEIEVADVVVAPQELELDTFSRKELENDKDAGKNLDTLGKYAQQPLTGKPRQIILKFLTSPAELIGKDGHVSALKMEHNELRPNASGTLQARGTGVYEIIPVDIIFRAIGYKGLPVPGVPYDERSGTIPNDKGRVKDARTGAVIAGEYVVGWAKRGPTGIIGTNKADAAETVGMALADVPALSPVADADADPKAAEAFIKAHKPSVVSYADWQILDRIEVEKGKPQGRPRVKFARVPEMLEAIERGRTS